MKNQQQQKFLVICSFYEGKKLRTKWERVEAKDYRAAVEKVKLKWKRFGKIDIHGFEDVTN